MDNIIKDDEINDKRSKMYSEYLGYVVMPLGVHKFKYKRDVHPVVYNNPQYKKWFNSNEFEADYTPLKKLIKGKSLVNNPMVRKEYLKSASSKDEVVIDVESLRIKEVLFWGYYREGAIPKIHHNLRHFVGVWAVVFTVWTLYYLIWLNRRRMERNMEKFLCDKDKQFLDTKYKLDSKSKEINKYMEDNPFDGMQFVQLNYAKKDLLRSLGIKKIKK